MVGWHTPTTPAQTVTAVSLADATGELSRSLRRLVQVQLFFNSTSGLSRYGDSRVP